MSQTSTRRSRRNRCKQYSYVRDRDRSRSPNFKTQFCTSSVNHSNYDRDRGLFIEHEFDEFLYQTKLNSCSASENTRKYIYTKSHQFKSETMVPCIRDNLILQENEISTKLGESTIAETQSAKLFYSLSGSDITDPLFHRRVQVNWDDQHLQVAPGMNYLAVCKNVECKMLLKNVISPRGLFPERNGYCALDREIYRIKCPVCQKPIHPDGSVGIGFFKCKFQVSYMLKASRKKSIDSRAEGECLVFGKCRKSSQEMFQYLDINVTAI